MNPEIKSIGQRKPLGRGARIALMGLALLGTVETTGAVSTETHNEQPVSAQTIPADLMWPRTAVEDFLKGLKGPEAPPTFDNKLDKGVIGANNITRMPQAEIDKQFPSAFEKLDDGKNTLQLLNPLDTSESVNPNAPLQFVKSFSGSTFAERQKYQGTGLYDTFEFVNVPGGTVILSPVDGYLTTSRHADNPPTDPNGADYFMGGSINFVAPNGSQYRLGIFGSTVDLQAGNDTRTGYVFQSLTDAPNYNKDYNQQAIGTYGIPVKKGQPILQVIQTADGSPIEMVGFRLFVAREGEIGKIDRNTPSIPSNIELLVTPNGELISPE